MTEHVRDVSCLRRLRHGARVGDRRHRLRGTGGARHGRGAPVRVHARLSCFDRGSELSRLNDDARPEVPTGPLVRYFAGAVAPAGRLSGGLVDATIGSRNERLGTALGSSRPTGCWGSA
jgi:hypothetical protein